MEFDKSARHEIKSARHKEAKMKPIGEIYNNLIYYIILKSVHAEKIFRSENDYKEYLNLMKSYALKYQLDLIGFLLLSDEVHLLLKASEIGADIKPFLHLINFKYRGVLKDRPKVILVEKEQYLLELTCYLHLKPVRANLVDKPEDYHFSSYSVYIGKENGLGIKVDSDCALEPLASNRQERIALYQQLIESDYFGRQEAWKRRIKEGSIIGSRNFINRIKEDKILIEGLN